jgi:6-pyruvoyltetrahydropterin/6-carboxytetrahydropterin synthase
MIKYFELRFSSAHFYSQAAWDPQKNKEIFGACYDPHGHGHNYRLLVGFEWTETSNFEETEKNLKDIVKVLDHHHLNYQIPDFKTKVPTTENIAIYLADQIKNKIKSPTLKSVKLFEMDDLWAEVHL